MTTPSAPNSNFVARRGFTLVETLTVIAIIGVLAAVIIPVVGKVRQSSRESHGLTNLRQVGMAALSFAMENRGQLPSLRLARAQQPLALNHWALLLRPHIDGSDTEYYSTFSDPSSGVKGPYAQVQFVPNTFVSPPTTFGQTVYTLNQIRNPAQVIFAADGVLHPDLGYTSQDIASLGGRGIWSAPVSMWSALYNPEHADDPIAVSDVLTNTTNTSDIAYRAQGGTAAKVVFVDGHAKIMKKGTILARNIQPGF